MKRILLLLVLVFSLGIGYGQVTIAYDFSTSGAVTGLNEASPGITLDANIGFGSFKNSGTSNPALNGGQLRLYQNGTKGGGIKIYASNGAVITSVVVNASSRTGPAEYTVDGGSAITVSGGAYIMSGLTASSVVEFYQKDANSSNRIYVDNFSVTYTTSGNTVTFDPNGGTGTMADQIASASTALTANTFTRTGFAFAGWATSAGGAVVYADEANYNFSADITLYALWKSIPTITNIVQSPTTVTAANVVSITADVTDPDGIFGVDINWGTTSGSLSNSVSMTNTTGNTYTGNIPAQSAGTTIYYEIYALDNNLDDNTSSELSYTVVLPPPANDLCAGAINIPVTIGSSCTPVSYTTVNATNSSASTTCSGYSGSADVWFELTVPASGELNVETTAGALTDGVMAIYSGSCGSLTQIECDDDDGPGSMPLLNLTGLTPNDVLYLLFWEWGGNNNGDFDICAWSPAPLSPCVTPTNQATALSFANITASAIDVSFTAASPAANNYLVVQSTSATLGGNPLDATTYAVNDAIGSGAVVFNGSGTAFNASGLTSATQYYFHIYAYNDVACSGGPKYNTTALVDSETTIAGPCVSESFDNASLSSNYADDSFTGDNGFIWTFKASRDENSDANNSGINGKAIMLRRSADDSKVTSASIAGGIADFSCKLYKGFTGAGNRQVELFVNGVSKGTSTIFDDDLEHTFTVTGINVSGNVIVEIRNITSKQVIVDNIEWTCYAATPSPEINLKGNTINIPSGNTAIALGDNTDFGDVLIVGGTKTNTFTIENTGDLVLNISNITSNVGDFTIGTFPASVAATSSATFDIVFDPSTIGTKTATITIASNDTDEPSYTFDIAGNATDVPSIVLNSTNPAVGSNNIVEGSDHNVVYAFNLAVSAFDAALTALNVETSGSFSNSNLTNMKAWYSVDNTFDALTDLQLGNNMTHSSGTYSTTAFTQTIANGNTAYVFITTDLDCPSTAGNTIIVDAITPANLSFTSGNVSGTAFAGAAQTITNDVPVNVSALSTSVCENGNTTLSWTAAPGCSDNYLVIASLSSLVSAPTSSSYTANATYGSGAAYDDGHVVYQGSGTTETVTGLSNGTNYTYTVFTRNGTTWSSGVEVDCTPTLVTFNHGDFRTTSNGVWNNKNDAASTVTWERYASGSWSVNSTSPSALNTNVYIRHNVEIPASTTPHATSLIIVEDTATLTFKASNPWTFRNLIIKDGGTVDMQTRFKILTAGSFEIENGGNFWFNYSSNAASSTNLTSSLWNGEEVFHPNSNFIVKDHETGSGNYFLPTAANLTSQTFSGVTAYFGNLIFDGTADSRFTTSNLSSATNYLTHRNLEFRPTSNVTLFYGSGSWIVGKDLIFKSGSTGNLTLTNQTNTIGIDVKGNFINNSDKSFRLVSVSSSSSPNVTMNVDGNIDIANLGIVDLNFASGGIGTINLKGDLTVAASAQLFANNAITATFNFNGTGDGVSAATTQIIDVASTNTSKLALNIKAGAYVQVANQNFELGADTKITVENGGSFDFGFNGTTALNLVAATGQTGTGFNLNAGGILHITSPDGISTTANTGNIQMASQTLDGDAIFHFIGKADQNTGIGLPLTARELYIEMENVDELTLTRPLDVSSSIGFDKGHIVTSTTNLLSLLDNATTTGASDNSYVSGPCRKIGDDAFEFPVGNDGNYQMIGISAPANSLDYFTAQYFQADPDVASFDNSNIPATIDHISSCEYWILNREGTYTDNVAVKLTWDANSCGVSNLSALRVVRWDGSAWENHGNTVTSGTTTSGNVTSAGVSSFSPFTLGSTTSGNPLPVALLYFQAENQAENVLVSWATATEINNDFFTVERSENGVDFKAIGEIKGAGNYSGKVDYSFLDEKPLDGMAYYRLKQTDFDGSYEYSKMLSVSRKSETSVLGSIFPNPAQNELNIPVSLAADESLTIQIFDITGRKIFEQKINSNAGFTIQKIDLNALLSGTYLINVISDTAIQASQFIKQ